MKLFNSAALVWTDFMNWRSRRISAHASTSSAKEIPPSPRSDRLEYISAAASAGWIGDMSLLAALFISLETATLSAREEER